jgi:hypothetical protein
VGNQRGRSDYSGSLTPRHESGGPLRPYWTPDQAFQPKTLETEEGRFRRYSRPDAAKATGSAHDDSDVEAQMASPAALARPEPGRPIP